MYWCSPVPAPVSLDVTKPSFHLKLHCGCRALRFAMLETECGVAVEGIGVDGGGPRVAAPGVVVSRQQDWDVATASWAE